MARRKRSRARTIGLPVPQESVPSAREVLRSLVLLGHRFPEFLDTKLGKLGLTLTGYRVLQEVDEVGPASMVHLSGTTGVTKAAITAVVDELEGKLLVRRVRDSEDRRVVKVWLTPAGRERITEARLVHEQAINGIVQVLGPMDLLAVVRAEKKIGRFVEQELSGRG